MSSTRPGARPGRGALSTSVCWTLPPASPILGGHAFSAWVMFLESKRTPLRFSTVRSRASLSMIQTQLCPALACSAVGPQEAPPSQCGEQTEQVNSDSSVIRGPFRWRVILLGLVAGGKKQIPESSEKP